MTDLNLTELDRLEREATGDEWFANTQMPDRGLRVDNGGITIIAEFVTIPRSQGVIDRALVVAARNQLRPLLELVDEMREALEILLDERDHLDADEPVWVLDPAFDIAYNALDDYRRAKGE